MVWFSLLTFSISSSHFTRGWTFSQHVVGEGLVNSLHKSPVNERADSVKQTPTIGNRYYTYVYEQAKNETQVPLAVKN